LSVLILTNKGIKKRCMYSTFQNEINFITKQKNMRIFKKLIIGAVVASAFQVIHAQTIPFRAKSVTDGYTLVWQDNFDGTTLDETNNWVVELDGGGGGNNELEYYRRENISVGVEPVTGANCLIITAKKENYAGKTCTSGRLKTAGKMSFKHGRIDARIKLPHTANGLWPAFWMMGFDYPTVGWPKCGEIDILEMGNTNGINRGTQDKYYSSWYHWGETWQNHPNWGQDATASSSIQDDFHLFTLIWNDNYLETYLDLDKYPTAAPLAHMLINGADVAGNAAHYFHKQFYVIFNLAIGGDFTGIHDINNVTALANGDAKMYVDYVRVYQQGVAGEEYSGPALATSAIHNVTIQNKFTVYPNPATNYVTIEGNQIPQSVTVINLQGQEIMTVLNTNQINIASLRSGIYLLKIKDSTSKTEIHKFTIK
jgi:beta-glucanase (GH16 family)